MRFKTMFIIQLLILSTLLMCQDKSVTPLITSTPDEVEEAPVVHSDYVPDSYQMVFNDEFSALNLDFDGDGSSNWVPWWSGFGVRYLEGNNDKAFKCDASYVGGGTSPLDVVLHEITDSLTLRLYGKVTPQEKLINVKQFPYIGGMISANESFSYTYGYIEMRLRVEVFPGQHWAVWLLPDDNTWPPEIDIAEIVGHQPSMVHMTAHYDFGSGHDSNFETFRNITTSDFHVYGFLWTRDTMVWYLDGREMKRMDNFVNKAMYPLISPEIGGNWTGLPSAQTQWPMACEIDYIRIYQQGN